MKVSSLAAAILLVGTAALAQKKDSLVIKHNPTIKHNARSTPLSRSGNPDVVAAALNRKSSTANDLAQIEHSGKVHAVGKTTAAAKPATVPNQVPASRNQPVKASKPNRNPAKGIAKVRKKTAKVG